MSLIRLINATTGVIGLTAAVSLLEQYADTGLRVTVVSDWLPEDVKSVMHASAQAVRGKTLVKYACADSAEHIFAHRAHIMYLTPELMTKSR